MHHLKIILMCCSSLGNLSANASHRLELGNKRIFVHNTTQHNDVISPHHLTPEETEAEKKLNGVPEGTQEEVSVHCVSRYSQSILPMGLQ